MDGGRKGGRKKRGGGWKRKRSEEGGAGAREWLCARGLFWEDCEFFGLCCNVFFSLIGREKSTRCEWDDIAEGAAGVRDEVGGCAIRVLGRDKDFSVFDKDFFGFVLFFPFALSALLPSFPASRPRPRLPSLPTLPFPLPPHPTLPSPSPPSRRAPPCPRPSPALALAKPLTDVVFPNFFFQKFPVQVARPGCG